MDYCKVILQICLLSRTVPKGNKRTWFALPNCSNEQSRRATKATQYAMRFSCWETERGCGANHRAACVLSGGTLHGWSLLAKLSIKSPNSPTNILRGGPESPTGLASSPADACAYRFARLLSCYIWNLGPRGYANSHFCNTCSHLMSYYTVRQVLQIVAEYVMIHSLCSNNPEFMKVYDSIGIGIGIDQLEKVETGKFMTRGTRCTARWASSRLKWHLGLLQISPCSCGALGKFFGSHASC